MQIVQIDLVIGEKIGDQVIVLQIFVRGEIKIFRACGVVGFLIHISS
jgi:hypothetical protein